MRLEDLDYPFPPERIAVAPAEPRDAARLMVVRRTPAGEPPSPTEHRVVRDLPALVAESVLRAGDLMVFNTSRVLPARFVGRRASTGGAVRGLYLRTEVPSAGEAGASWAVLLEARGALREGERVELDAGAGLVLRRRDDEGIWSARLDADADTSAVLARVGAVPLPPYIRQARRARGLPADEAGDAERYNTVYARAPGSVAAPTAGLHFTPDLLAALDRAGIRRAEATLHVGLGTFAPVRSAEVERHAIHREAVSVPPETLRALRDARARGARIIAVGTTTVRALESLPEDWSALAERHEGYAAQTSLFILPGFRFRFTDALLTNFHLPRSTLLALVAALPGVGLGQLKAWYAEAIARGYRFYSYGDAMLIV